MGFNFHVGLPGPFSYTRRIGGSTKRKPRPALWKGWAIALVALVVLSVGGGVIGLVVGLVMVAFMTVVTVKGNHDA